MPERIDSPATYAGKGDPSSEVGGPDGFVDASEQAQDEKDLVIASWKRYEQIRDYKYSMVRPADWRRYALIYGDQHWDASTYEEWQSTPTINLTFAAINAILPIITDNSPTIVVVPRDPSDDMIANVIGKVIEWLWEYCGLDMMLPKTMLNALIFGNGFWKVMWDPNARAGLGDISVKNVDPVNIFFNPEATTVDDATEIVHVEQMPLSWIKAMYPEKAELVKAGVQDGNILVNRPQLPQRGNNKDRDIEIKSTTGSAYKIPSSAASNADAPPKETATVMERWLYDTKKNAWRKIVISNRVLLSDEMTDFETPPFVHFVDFPVPWTIWASGEVQHVENLQYEINRRRGMILDILRHCAMPMLVVDPASGVDHETIKAKPNLVIPAEGGPSAVGVLAPQMDLGGLFNVNDRDKQDFNDILGNVDMVMGKAPTGVEAGVALEQLAESANTRLRLKVRYMEGSLRRAGQVLLKMIQKHYTTQRIFRIVGSEFGQQGQPQAPQFFSINQPSGMQPMMGEGGMPMMGEDGLPQEQPAYDETSNQIPADAEFDVRIGAGSTLPVSKSARFQQAITLFDRGAIDQQELLKSAAWPKWEEVLARMQMQQQQMMMAQQGMNPEGVPPPPPGSPEELMGEGPPQEGVAA